MNVSLPQLLSPWESGITKTGLFLYARQFLAPAAVFFPFLYGITSVRSSLRKKSDALQIWRKNYANFRKLSPFMFPGKNEDSRSYKIDLATVATCSVLSRVFNALLPILLRRIIDQLADSSTNQIPLVEVLVFIALRQVVSEAVTTLHWNKFTHVESAISNRLCCCLYDKTLALSADWHDTTQPMDTYVAIITGGPRFGRFVMSILFDKVAAIIDLLVAIAAFWRLFGSRLALAMAAIAVVYVWAARRIIPATRREEFATVLRLRREQHRIGGDALRNWHTVAAFNNVAHEQARHRDAASRTVAMERERGSSRVQVTWKKNVVLALGLLVLSLMTTGRIKSGRGQQGVGDYVMLLQFWNDLAFPIQNFVSWAGWFDDFFVESDKIIEILEKQPTVRDKDGAPEFRLLNGDIEFDQVSFSYKHDNAKDENDAKEEVTSDKTKDKDDEKRADNAAAPAAPAVKNMSFKVKGGTTVAIVGETGGGKSTLLRLLCRLHDVDSGSIRIDGQDIRDVQLGSLMQHVSIVPQIISVFNDTVASNLKYGNFTATQADCEAACEAAALHKKIVSSFQKQYEEIVGEHGTRMSGGELQRLAIARVLLRHDASNKIVLFDEAMSSLDSETEWEIQRRLREFGKGRTVIIIAHRLATVAHADLILAIKNGVIVESGGQEELLAKRGYYYNLWDKQKLQSETTCR